MGKKPIVSVTYENERISKNNSLPYLKCVLRLPCVVHGLIYGRFTGFYVNGLSVIEDVCYFLGVHIRSSIHSKITYPFPQKSHECTLNLWMKKL